MVGFLLFAAVASRILQPGYVTTTVPPLAAAQQACATVKLVAGGDSGVSGTLTLIQGPRYLYIMGKIFGLEPGLHGFHIHTTGDTSNNCKASGGHFNPGQVREAI